MPAEDQRLRSGRPEEYKVQMPSCVGGMCVRQGKLPIGGDHAETLPIPHRRCIDCCAEGLCNCKVPFYIYPAGSSGGKGEEIGKIVKMWRGLGTEVFTDAAICREVLNSASSR